MTVAEYTKALTTVLKSASADPYAVPEDKQDLILAVQEWLQQLQNQHSSQCHGHQDELDTVCTSLTAQAFVLLSSDYRVLQRLDRMRQWLDLHPDTAVTVIIDMLKAAISYSNAL